MQIRLVPEVPPVVDFDDVVDVGHASGCHVGGAAGDGTVPAVSLDGPGSEALPFGGVIAGIVHGGLQGIALPLARVDPI